MLLELFQLLLRVERRTELIGDAFVDRRALERHSREGGVFRFRLSEVIPLVHDPSVSRKIEHAGGTGAAVLLRAVEPDRDQINEHLYIRARVYAAERKLLL